MLEHQLIPAPRESRPSQRRASWHVEPRSTENDDQSAGDVMRTLIVTGKLRRISLSAIIGLTLTASAANPAAAQSLISIDFGEGTQPLLFQGIEPQAAALDPAFGTAGIWNELIGSRNSAEYTTNPSYTGLVDSTGTATAASFSITGGIDGGVSSFNSVTVFGRPNPDGRLSMLGDYIFWNSNPAFNVSIDWRISGLVPAASHQMVLYGANSNVNRAFDMLVDTDGDGDLTDEVAVAVPSLNGADPPPAYLPAIRASASGEISGRAVGRGGPFGVEADWAGFQVTDAPGLAGRRCAGRRPTMLATGTAPFTGTPGADVIVGDSADNRIDGGGGRDVICGGSGADLLTGGSGTDRLYGQLGNDRLAGANGKDRLSGGPGRDRSHGGPGRDRIATGAGNDRIETADATKDIVDCGSGRDRVNADGRDRLRRCERVRRPRASQAAGALS